MIVCIKPYVQIASHPWTRGDIGNPHQAWRGAIEGQARTMKLKPAVLWSCGRRVKMRPGRRKDRKDASGSPTPSARLSSSAHRVHGVRSTRDPPGRRTGSQAHRAFARAMPESQVVIPISIGPPYLYLVRRTS
ncbi:uncharacterized protein B0H18DRAFT_422115 [Fomitopsis serialis]|uniref:uncharacterized protein n=1 Tax=Fomitopsis serialis TaxID=139415 RepID=UPI002007784E|nr:uncharacterized protein B0H18DRAFT_422115 [Neoantrodia serialis]KAH9935746.1 hypothetical protein B0H18DRAFT_422115 [Neoantrodia serialis]